jgi:hypothetical protein
MSLFSICILNLYMVCFFCYENDIAITHRAQIQSRC